MAYSGTRTFRFNGNEHHASGMTPQAELVLDVLLRDGRITRLNAMHYGISNLTARIAELRDVFYDGPLDVFCSEKYDLDKRRYGTWTIGYKGTALLHNVQRARA